jgi:hypothetical protein
VILEPEAWGGNYFPLSGHISPPIDLSSGAWVVLLYHHDCSECQDALPMYEELAATQSSAGNPLRILLLEIPPYGRQVIAAGASIHARLSNDREWFVEAPVEIQIAGGKVVSASRELPSLAVLY